MSVIVEKSAGLLDMLPESDQSLVYELIKKLVLAWDPDFTKVTPEERKRLDIADEEFIRGETISHNSIDWE